jgi:hypothetical protein
VDLTEPPEVSGIAYDTICDPEANGCDEVTLDGGIFVNSEALSCIVKLVKVSLNVIMLSK